MIAHLVGCALCLRALCDRCVDRVAARKREIVDCETVKADGALDPVPEARHLLMAAAASLPNMTGHTLCMSSSQVGSWLPEPTWRLLRATILSKQ